MPSKPYFVQVVNEYSSGITRDNFDSDNRIYIHLCRGTTARGAPIL